jgi:dihydrofolate reductase
MRKVFLKMHASLDGFVTGEKGEMDWLFEHFGDEMRDWEIPGLWAAGVHVMGTNTYKEMAETWPSSDSPIAPPMNEIPKVVFSNSLESADWAETRIESGDVADVIPKLKQEPGKDILVHGGPNLVQQLTRENLIDEYRVVVHPVALGAGKPLFAGHVDLELVETESFPKGAVALTYRRR